MLATFATRTAPARHAARPARTAILFDATRPRPPGAARRAFGAGLLAFTPASGRVGYTAEDEDEYLALRAEEDRELERARAEAAREFDRFMDEMAEAAMMLDRACSGPML